MFRLFDVENGSRVPRCHLAFLLVGLSVAQLGCVCGEDGSIVGPRNNAGGGAGSVGGGDGGSTGGGGSTNSAPVANAGVAQNAPAGAAVVLDGSNCRDEDGDRLLYQWSFESVPNGSAATLSDATAVKPTFTPDKAGSYVLQLIVSDGKASSAPSTVTITVAVGNSAPVANAGVAQNVTLGAVVTLDGSGSSDADEDPLTYSWWFGSVPSGSAAAPSDATAARPTFTADKAGSYVVHLVVSDGKVSSAASTVTISVASATTTTTWIPTFWALKGHLASATDTGADANNDFVAQSAVVSVPPIRFYNPAVGGLRLYKKDAAGPYAINFNGSSIASLTPFSDGGTVALSSLSHFLSMPYVATSAPVTVRVVFANAYVSGCSASQLLILNASGKILKAASACGSASPLSVTFAGSANAEVLVAFTRVTDTSGGLRVFELDLDLTK